MSVAATAAHAGLGTGGLGRLHRGAQHVGMLSVSRLFCGGAHFRAILGAGILTFRAARDPRWVLEAPSWGEGRALPGPLPGPLRETGKDELPKGDLLRLNPTQKTVVGRAAHIDKGNAFACKQAFGVGGNFVGRRDLSRAVDNAFVGRVAAHDVGRCGQDVGQGAGRRGASTVFAQKNRPGFGVGVLTFKRPMREDQEPRAFGGNLQAGSTGDSVPAADRDLNGVAVGVGAAVADGVNMIGGQRVKVNRHVGSPSAEDIMLRVERAATRFLLKKSGSGYGQRYRCVRDVLSGPENGLEMTCDVGLIYLTLQLAFKRFPMFFILTLVVLIGVMAALVSYLQYDAAWWKGILWSALMVSISFGLIIFKNPEEASLDNPLIVSASMGMMAAIYFAIASLATIAARGRFSERQTVSAAFFGGMVLFLGVLL